MTPRLNDAAGTSGSVLRQLTRADAQRVVEGLADLLLESVRDGASLGCLAPLDRDLAMGYWNRLQARLGDAETLWIAEDARRVIACVHLSCCMRETERHRADLRQLVVRPYCRRRGIATALLAQAEAHAVSQGRTLLVANAKAGSPADRSLGRPRWQCAGVVPGYAASPDGELRDAVRLFRSLVPATR